MVVGLADRELVETIDPAEDERLTSIAVSCYHAATIEASRLVHVRMIPPMMSRCTTTFGRWKLYLCLTTEIIYTIARVAECDQTSRDM